MLKRYSQALAAVALAWFGGAAYAQQPATSAPSSASAAAAAANCSTCAPACETSCGGFYGSAGVLFLKACSNGDNSYSSFDCPYHNGLPTAHFTTINDFDNGINLGYRMEAGWTDGCGWGARLRYFYFESADSQFVIDNISDVPDAGDGIISVKHSASPLGIQFQSVGNATDPSQLVFQNRVRVAIWDLEATKNTRCGCLDLTWSLGIRYLQINQDYNADEALINLPPSTNFPAQAFTIDQHIRSQHTLNGLGPILGLEGRHTLWDTLRIYGSGRVGFIFCQGHQEAFYLGNFDPSTELAPVFRSASETRSKMVTNAEVELGLEYGYELSRNSEAYLRVGLVGMVFGGAGNSSRSAIGAPPEEAKNENLSLFGINVSVGVRY
ncbi:MAG TPA: Lpg1974 family pore-forming outer membrane protein [Gemmatales bacterium]|nr:Lpg1974 family pore-forming outer membrane protein [Gemmatales bacterium]